MRVLVLSPHFDDAPLSLGQSMLDGALAGHDVRVGVVFGRSSWTQWFHPAPSRARVVSLVRRVEEMIAARRFGYRLVVAPLSEVILRTGDMSSESYLDPRFDPATAPELDEVVRIAERWAADADVVVAPLALGDHVDHQLVTEAGRRLAAAGRHVAFYEDRPYACSLGDDEIATQVELRFGGPTMAPHDASGPIGRIKHDRLWYPSQLDDFFHTAMRLDEELRRRERLWAPEGATWLDALVAGSRP